MEVEVPPGFRFFKDEIKTAATAHGIEPALGAALVWQESSFQADAFRFEPNFWNRYLKLNPLYRHLNPRRVSSSYGLCQVMYCRVLEDKLTDNDALPPEHLFVPSINLDTGFRLLAELKAWTETFNATPEIRLHAALASYNGGRGGNKPGVDNPLRNGKYAREVLHKRSIMARLYEQ